MHLGKYQLVLLLFCSCTGLHAQVFQNLNMEGLCTDSITGLCHWQKSWGGARTIRQDETATGNRAMLIETRNGGVGFAEQAALITGKREMKILTFSGRIRTEGATGKGAGLNIGIYDKEGRLLFNRDMGYGSFSWISGNTDWTTCTLSAICAPEAAKIKIGAILYGSGKAWFDDFEVALVPVRGRKPSRLAKTYLSGVIDTLSTHSLRKDSVNFRSLKKQALKIAGPARNPADCHLAVTYLLAELHDHHSFFMTPEEVKSWEGNGESNPADLVYPKSEIIADCGYIWVPYFHGGDPKRILAYADSLQHILRNLDKSNIKGWIVDLRDNTGGNMGPMIAGLGPLFTGEKLGCLFDVNGGSECWTYKDDAFGWDGRREITPTHPVTLPHARPIAVLISNQTGSSGEIVAISFVGNGKTRLFGQPTWGLTTGNGNFDLPDGARMMLASTIMADRNGKRFFGPVPPDMPVTPGNIDGKDPVMQAALNWVSRFEKD